MDNLTVPLKAREAYVASQSSEKIPSTLIHNARTSGNIKYTTDDSVYWNVLVKDGGEVLGKFWTNSNNKSYLKIGAAL